MSVLYIAVLAVALQRLAELVVARRNTSRLRAMGGVEHGVGHYPFIVALHLAWLAALVLLVPPDAEVNWGLLGLYVVLQGLRYWSVAALGDRWTTRVIVVPGQAPVRRGPYRFLRHPNYAVVAVEIALLPLAFGAWQIAIVFSVLNAIVLAHRIRIENNALRDAAAAMVDRTETFDPKEA